jgi:hypothetical protein
MNRYNLINVIVFLFICRATFAQQNNINLTTSKDTIFYKTFKTEQGWGYDIYIKEKLYVHQPNIPAVSGSTGFTKEEYAAKTAHQVMDKIRKHISPPTITVGELDSLKVIK